MIVLKKLQAGAASYNENDAVYEKMVFYNYSNTLIRDIGREDIETADIEQRLLCYGLTTEKEALYTLEVGDGVFDTFSFPHN